MYLGDACSKSKTSTIKRWELPGCQAFLGWAWGISDWSPMHSHKHAGLRWVGIRSHHPDQNPRLGRWWFPVPGTCLGLWELSWPVGRFSETWYFSLISLSATSYFLLISFFISFLSPFLSISVMITRFAGHGLTTQKLQKSPPLPQSVTDLKSRICHFLFVVAMACVAFSITVWSRWYTLNRKHLPMTYDRFKMWLHHCYFIPR